MMLTYDASVLTLQEGSDRRWKIEETKDQGNTNPK